MLYSTSSQKEKGLSLVNGMDGVYLNS